MRIRVFFEDEKGKTRRVETLGGKLPSKSKFLVGDVLVFNNQEDGALAIVSTSLVKKIVREEQDPKYGTYSVVEKISVDDLEAA